MSIAGWRLYRLAFTWQPGRQSHLFGIRFIIIIVRHSSVNWPVFGHGQRKDMRTGGCC